MAQMSSSDSLTSEHLLVQKAAPGWVALGLLSLGGASILLALWLLLAPDLYSSVGSAADISSAEHVGAHALPSGSAEGASQAVAVSGRERESSAVSQTPSPLGAGLEEAFVAPPALQPAIPLAKVVPSKGTVRAPPCAAVLTVTFARNSTVPALPDQQAAIVALRGWLDRHPKATVVLEGHTDALGDEEYNLLLSYRRAQGVAALLTDAGLPRERLVVRALGEQLPLAGAAAESPNNRRVVVRTEGADECPKPH